MTKQKFFGLFLLCALIPLVTAKLALAFGWFSNTGVNRGHWLSNEVYLFRPSQQEPHLWRLVYVNAGACESACKLALTGLQQFYAGLGAKQDRVQVMLAADSSPVLLNQFPSLHWLALDNVTPELRGKFLLLNPRGMALLSYDLITAKDMSVLARDMRTDLLRLLKYDREGL